MTAGRAYRIAVVLVCRFGWPLDLVLGMTAGDLRLAAYALGLDP